MKRFILALLAATISLSVTAASINLNSSRSNTVTDERSTTVNTSKSNPYREQASLAADCGFTIDEKGVGRQATPKEKQACDAARLGTSGHVNAAESNGTTLDRAPSVCHSDDCPGCKYTCRSMGGACLCIEGGFNVNRNGRVDQRDQPARPANR